MKEVLVVELLSSGVMYPEEIIERGYKALILVPTIDDEEVMKDKRSLAKYLEDKYPSEALEIIYVKPLLEEMTKALSGHEDNIIACVAGSEYGVRFVDDICKYLNVPGNNPDTNKLRTSKSGMIEALKAANLRYIKTAIVKNENDIVDFFKTNDIRKVFMKFSESAGSIGNKACNSLEEALDYYREMLNMANHWGENDDDILIQEFIDGPEYVVNTVSCKGCHAITDMWKYKKIENNLGDTLYQSSALIESITPEVKDMVDYSLKVLDAVDLKYGPVHGEYKIDHKGPVLIETNCRPMGDSTTRDYMRDITGNCIVDWALDAWLDPEKFISNYPNREYKSVQSAIKKYVILPEETTGSNAIGLTISEHLATFHNHNGYDVKNVSTYPKTRDLCSSPLIIKCADKNIDSIKYDVELINFVEQNYPDLLICPTEYCKGGFQHDISHLVESLCDNFKPLSSAEESLRSLCVTDSDAYEVVNNSYAPVSDQTPQVFDQVLYADARPMPMAKKIRDILELLKYLRPGGVALICQDIAETLPYGIKGFDVLKKVARI